jgi:biotin carboxylase
LPDNIGHKFSHQSVDCSTIDMEGVLSAARKHRVDGICTFCTDVAVPSVAFVCETLGLPGLSFQAAETMTSKHLFRRFLRDHGLPHPAFAVGESFEQIETHVHALTFPLMFKPVDTSGSRGILKIDKPHDKLERAAFEHAKTYSRSGIVCVEEFIQGTEVGGDGFLIGGRFAFIAITHKHLHGFAVGGHSLPPLISKNDQVRVREALEDCCQAIGYTAGPLNFDALVTPNSIIIIEMSPRNGGNGIPAVIRRATGVDVEQATLMFSLGQVPNMTETARDIGAASWVFGSERAGILKNLKSLEEVRNVVPEVFDLHQVVPLGAKVEHFEHNGNLLGYVLFDCKSPQDYSSLVQKIDKALGLDIEPIH